MRASVLVDTCALAAVPSDRLRPTSLVAMVVVSFRITVSLLRVTVFEHHHDVPNLLPPRFRKSSIRIVCKHCVLVGLATILTATITLIFYKSQSYSGQTVIFDFDSHLRESTNVCLLFSDSTQAECHLL